MYVRINISFCRYVLTHTHTHTHTHIYIYKRVWTYIYIYSYTCMLTVCLKIDAIHEYYNDSLLRQVQWRYSEHVL